ncbi:hypothetical protein BXZ70DRAFT_1013200 [Cristinia sonorae]|uniref:Uncharacterized protein n=1 Tax=Cristinia sonorae TaxID=1940300 RepID=A0A8K0UF36_9AGAR|nr:hypothetical protein BXZ70DRAFT_1013200 [Cristinia sonorae]
MRYTAGMLFHPKAKSKPSETVGRRPDLAAVLEQLRTGDKAESAWEAMRQEDAETMVVSYLYYKTFDVWEMYRVVDNKADDSLELFLPNAQLGMMRLFCYRLHQCIDLCFESVWEDPVLLSSTLWKHALVEATFMQQVMEMILTEMRGSMAMTTKTLTAKASKSVRAEWQRKRVATLDAWLALDVRMGGDMSTYLDTESTPMDVVDGDALDNEEEIERYLNNNKEKIIDDNWLDERFWDHLDDRSEWFKTLKGAGWCTTVIKQPQFKGWTSVPPLHQGLPGEGPTPSNYVEKVVAEMKEELVRQQASAAHAKGKETAGVERTKQSREGTSRKRIKETVQGHAGENHVMMDIDVEEDDMMQPQTASGYTEPSRSPSPPIPDAGPSHGSSPLGSSAAVASETHHPLPSVVPVRTPHSSGSDLHGATWRDALSTAMPQVQAELRSPQIRKMKYTGGIIFPKSPTTTSRDTVGRRPDLVALLGELKRNNEAAETWDVMRQENAQTMVASELYYERVVNRSADESLGLYLPNSQFGMMRLFCYRLHQCRDLCLDDVWKHPALTSSTLWVHARLEAAFMYKVMELMMKEMKGSMAMNRTKLKSKVSNPVKKRWGEKRVATLDAWVAFNVRLGADVIGYLENDQALDLHGIGQDVLEDNLEVVEDYLNASQERVIDRDWLEVRYWEYPPSRAEWFKTLRTAGWCSKALEAPFGNWCLLPPLHQGLQGEGPCPTNFVALTVRNLKEQLNQHHSGTPVGLQASAEAKEVTEQSVIKKSRRRTDTASSAEETRRKRIRAAIQTEQGKKKTPMDVDAQEDMADVEEIAPSPTSATARADCSSAPYSTPASEGLQSQGLDAANAWQQDISDSFVIWKDALSAVLPPVMAEGNRMVNDVASLPTPTSVSYSEDDLAARAHMGAGQTGTGLATGESEVTTRLTHLVRQMTGVRKLLQDAVSPNKTFVSSSDHYDVPRSMGTELEGDAPDVMAKLAELAQRLASVGQLLRDSLLPLDSQRITSLPPDSQDQDCPQSLTTSEGHLESVAPNWAEREASASVASRAKDFAAAKHTTVQGISTVNLGPNTQQDGEPPEQPYQTPTATEATKGGTASALPATVEPEPGKGVEVGQKDPRYSFALQPGETGAKLTSTVGNPNTTSAMSQPHRNASSLSRTNSQPSRDDTLWLRWRGRSVASSEKSALEGLGEYKSDDEEELAHTESATLPDSRKIAFWQWRGREGSEEIAEGGGGFATEAPEGSDRLRSESSGAKSFGSGQRGQAPRLDDSDSGESEKPIEEDEEEEEALEPERRGNTLPHNVTVDFSKLGLAFNGQTDCGIIVKKPDWLRNMTVDREKLLVPWGPEDLQFRRGDFWPTSFHEQNKGESDESDEEMQVRLMTRSSQPADGEEEEEEEEEVISNTWKQHVSRALTAGSIWWSEWHNRWTKRDSSHRLLEEAEEVYNAMVSLREKMKGWKKSDESKFKEIVAEMEMFLKGDEDGVDKLVKGMVRIALVEKRVYRKKEMQERMAKEIVACEKMGAMGMVGGQSRILIREAMKESGWE